MERETDVVIIGTGAAGLFCALQLPENKKITVITKDKAENSDSFLAQGGICVLRSEEDYDRYFEDTMKAGHYENNEESVAMMIRSSGEIIDLLIKYGVEFECRDGKLIYTREGGHSQPRILFHEDVTGKEITGKLLARARERENITIYENTEMIDILCQDNVCYGIAVVDSQGKVLPILARHTVFACGGIGGLYHHSTNFAHLTGDGIALALRHKVKLQDVNFVQIHPTTLYSERPGRRFLISESVRGEGAVLYNANMERFVDELLPRDVVTHAIEKQMKADGKPYVWLSMEYIAKEDILGHFPNIYQRCLEEGYDVTKECIPVVPGQHYFMGGIQSDLEGRTSMRHLYAVGETSCNGVHGANRLASNSLLESLVFARRAAVDLAKERQGAKDEAGTELFQPEFYTNIEKLRQENKALVQQEIERMKREYEQQHNHEVECR
ncbi:MAG: L-aspartate oxidase [Lachnospiraceae bacterium]|nr:L-aspartate oxidase [Lachnospiraceae bacterium]